MGKAKRGSSTKVDKNTKDAASNGAGKKVAGNGGSAKKQRAESVMTRLRATLVVTLVAISLQWAVKNYYTPSAPPAANKPYTTMEEFFPFYLTEHSNLICRRLHFAGTSLVLLVAVNYPSLIANAAAAASLGLAVMPLFTAMETGIVEGLACLLTFVLLSRRTTGACAALCRGAAAHSGTALVRVRRHVVACNFARCDCCVRLCRAAVRGWCACARRVTARRLTMAWRFGCHVQALGSRRWRCSRLVTASHGLATSSLSSTNRRRSCTRRACGVVHVLCAAIGVVWPCH